MKTKYLIYIPLIVSALFLSMCTNTKKGAKKDMKNLKSKTENKMNAVKEKTAETTAKTKQYFENKTNLAKAKVSLEKSKIDLRINHDKQKTTKDLDNVNKYLSNVKSETDQKFNTNVSNLKEEVSNIKLSIKKDDKATTIKLNNIGHDIDVMLDNFQDKMHNDQTKLVKDFKRHYAELRAKEFLYKAKIASSKKETYAKADAYLDKADQEYVKAEQYGNAKYKTTIEDLRKDIKAAKKSLKAKSKEAKKKVDSIITKLGKYTVQSNIDYPYIIIP